jgi:hypothetical protein
VCLPPLDVERLVVPVLLWELGVGIGVDARHRGGATGLPRGPTEARRHGERGVSRSCRGGRGATSPIPPLPGRDCPSWPARTPCAWPCGACARWSGRTTRRSPHLHPSPVTKRHRQRWVLLALDEETDRGRIKRTAAAVEQVRRPVDRKNRA